MSDSRRPDLDRHPELRAAWDRRQFLKSAAAGTAMMAFGGALLRIAADDLTRSARAENRPDGRPRLPPGQRSGDHRSIEDPESEHSGRQKSTAAFVRQVC